MEALAQIAGGIAPALSDLLTVIRGQAGLLLDSADHDAAAQAPLNQIYTAAERAGSLLRQLQIFSQQQTAHPEIMDLNALIGETAGVLRRLLGDGITSEFLLDAELPLIVADADMMEQLLLILAQNARDAMPTGGRLVIKTAMVETKELPAANDLVAGVADPGFPAKGLAKAEPASARPATCHQPGGRPMDATDAFTPDALDDRPGKWAVLRVDDTGGGIAPGILPRIFEPFFTT
jgi:signal transduction histidine kinase